MRTLLLLVFVTPCFLGLATSAEPNKTGPQIKLPGGITPDQLTDPNEAKKIAEMLEKESGENPPEAMRMLIAILKGSQLDGSDGWFGPAATRYSWYWLARRAQVDPKKGTISAEKFPGPAALFDGLDRDGDGKIDQADLDWTGRSPYVMRANILNRLVRNMDKSGDGKVSHEEFEALFKMVGQGKEYFTAEDFRRALIPRGPNSFSPGDAPSIPILVKGLFAGEIGSMNEGPKVNDPAPDFKLKSVDGKETVQLSNLIGPKPVVLVFGNFTCGPFRSLYPDVDAIYQRFKDQATFVMVYVREAHPLDGWKMESNTKAGVAAKQPTNYSERQGVCDQFCKLLKPGMVVVVDDVLDPTGTAYSGMPARLYVIDTKGQVAYKSGRGPFGFKPGEMEQALMMSLLEASPGKNP